MMTGDDQAWASDLHSIIVYSATPPDGKWDDWSLEYEVIHPDSCGRIEGWREGTYDYLGRPRDCFVDYCIDGCGLAWSLDYSHTPISRPGTYLVRAWGTRTYYYDMGYEYDDGIAVIGPGTIQKLLPGPTTPRQHQAA